MQGSTWLLGENKRPQALLLQHTPQPYSSFRWSRRCQAKRPIFPALAAFPTGEGAPGEQHEFTAYGLLLAAATGRAVLAHELSDALSASDSGLGAALASGSGGSGSSSRRPGGRSPGSSGSGPSSKSGGVWSRLGSAEPGSSTAAGAAHTAATAGAAAVSDDRFVGHALAVCRAFLGNDFVNFLRLYESAPRMSPYLMDALLAKMRGKAYSELAAVHLALGASGVVIVC